MLMTFDISSVQRFADNLAGLQTDCNGEGMVCSDLDEKIRCQSNVCVQLLNAIRSWAREVFTGRIESDPAVETLFRQEIGRVLSEAVPLVRFANNVKSPGFVLEHLDGLAEAVSNLERMTNPWVSPGKSISPAPRMAPTEEADKQIRERISELPPLPEGWEPNDPRQLRRFKNRPNS